MFTEPFRIKTIEPIVFLTRRQRLKVLAEAGYNIFKVPGDKIAFDFLTDSGTGALSKYQLAASGMGDEAYSESESWLRFKKAIQKLSGKKEIIPVHQARGAEKLLAEVLVSSPGDFILSNTLYDTTRGNFESAGANCLDFLVQGELSSWKKFKGNLDLKKAEKFLRQNNSSVKAIVLTLTNNTNGGQPVSYENVFAASKLAASRNIPLILDACRISENGFFIKKLEKGFERFSVQEIIKKLCGLADVVYMSAKKDGLSDAGGFLSTNNKSIAANLRRLANFYEGYPTSGGMSGKTMESAIRGFEETAHEDYLDYRVSQVAYLHSGLAKIGFSLVNPPGGHAVYIDAAKTLAHVKKNNFPAQTLIVAFYAEAGMRCSEMAGSLTRGMNEPLELVRLAIPRRVYTKSHIESVLEAGLRIWKQRKNLRGFTIVQAPKHLRQFSAVLKPLTPSLFYN
ncbi:MAG: tryptophanase [Candidatus Brennerbacteria bacterium]|nr:tryptophanase [Candidatus Brennerbacteria bacterium]